MLIRHLRFLAMLLLAGLTAAYGCSSRRVQYSYFDYQRDRGGWLGMSVQDVTERLAEKKKLTVKSGAYVTEVMEDSPAERAGIQEGDVITKFDGKNIEESDDLIRAVRRTKAKTEVSIDVVRGGEKKTLAATLERRPRSYAYSFRFPDNNLMPMPPRPPETFRFHLESRRTSSGLEVQDLKKQLAQFFNVPGNEGVLVAEVEKGSDAEQAGFKAGDVITKADNHKVGDSEDLWETLGDYHAGDQVKFEVYRKGSPLTLRMKITEEDDDVSFKLYDPSKQNDSKLYFWDSPLKLHRDNLEAFKENLRRFKDRLKENMEELKRKLKKEFQEISTRIASIIKVSRPLA